MNDTTGSIPAILLQSRDARPARADALPAGWIPQIVFSLDEASAALAGIRRHPLSSLSIIAIDPFFPDLDMAFRRLRAIHPRVVVLSRGTELLGMAQLAIPPVVGDPLLRLADERSNSN